MPETGPGYTKAHFDRAMARIAAKRAIEDESLIFENYMRVLAKAFARRASRHLAKAGQSNPTIERVAHADVDLVPMPRVVKPRRKRGTVRD